MNTYKDLAPKYLKLNMKRTVLTIFGVGLAAAVLFSVLTLFFSSFVEQRDAARKENNYEIAFLVKDEATAQAIASEKQIKSAYIGDMSDFNGNLTKNVLFVNTKNPYRINKIAKNISEKYMVDAKINDVLAEFYMQGYQGDGKYILLLIFLFASVIMAIVGVGIIRNSIQLNAIEQIKDYGILRCLGCTPKQLKAIIGRMSLMLETIGVGLGFIVGFIIAVLLGINYGIKVKLLIVPVLYVIVAFFGDLIFVISENAKLVKGITPIEAVRGQLKTGGKKIKRRGKGLFGLLFGFKGEYAHKNLMANKGRFVKSVVVFSLGISAVIASSTVVGSVVSMKQRYSEIHAYYQMFEITPKYLMNMSEDENEAGALSYSSIEDFARNSYIDDVKPLYIARTCPVDMDKNIELFDELYLADTWLGRLIEEAKLEVSNDRKGIKALVSRNVIEGMSDSDKDYYEKHLLEGTLDVSENGVIIPRYVYEIKYNESEEVTEDDLFPKRYRQNKLEIGDKLELVYPKELRERVEAARNAMTEKEKSDISYSKTLSEIKNQMVTEGKYKTFTVEGIVDREIAATSLGDITVIMPLENYFSFTGYTKDDTSGVVFRIDESKVSLRESNDISEFEFGESDKGYYVNEYGSYLMMMKYLEDGLLKAGSFIILILVAISSVNIINTCASNLNLRKKELAQLRAVGVSKKEIIFMVSLEGLITAFVANVIGDLLGYFVLMPLARASIIMGGFTFVFPVQAAVFGLVISVVILGGAYYVPIKKMSNGLLDNLNASGD